MRDLTRDSGAGTLESERKVRFVDGNKEAGKYTLQSVDKALKVLDLFYGRQELGPGDVAALMDMNRSTAFRFLTTFEENGYLTKTEQGRYRLGMKLFSLGQLAYSHTELISYTRPQLIRLAELCGETSHLVVMDGGTNVIFLDKGVPQSPLHMDVEIGRRYAAHHTATGKAILAFQPRTTVEQYLRTADFDRLTDSTLCSPEALLDELRAIRAQGWSADREECIPGLTCFAAPIQDGSGRAAAAISVSGPTTRMLANEETNRALVQAAAAQISRLLR